MSHETSAPLFRETFDVFKELMKEYIRENKKRLDSVKKQKPEYQDDPDNHVDEKEIRVVFDLIQGTGPIKRVIPFLGYAIRHNKDFFQRTVDFINQRDFTVIHLVRFYRIANLHPPRFYMRFCLSPIGEKYRNGGISLNTIAEGMETLKLDVDDAAFDVLSGGYLSDEDDYAFFFDRPHLLLKGLKEEKGGWFYPEQKALTLRILRKMPDIPDDILQVIWDYALSEAKTLRLDAQIVLDPLPKTLSTILDALESSKAATRSVAAQWLARLRNPEAVKPLRDALNKEKADAVRIELMKALVACGVSLDDLLDRNELFREAEKSLKKPVPKALEWFPFEKLPLVHWNDGTTVDPKIVQYWLVQAAKMKTPEPNPLLSLYGQQMNRSDCKTVARFVLETWIERDTKLGTEAEKIEQLRSDPKMSAYFRMTPNATDADLKRDFEFFFTGKEPLHSATDCKGILGLVAAWGDETLPAAMENYVREWYGWRVHQSRALVVALGGMENTAAIQALLSISRKMKTKSIREEAENAIKNLAERKNWTLNQLADRTAPTAGLDERREIAFDLGGRKITARWTTESKLFPYDESGKQLKAFPGQLKSDDETLYAEAKKMFQAANKLLKTTVTQQTDRLYEAMCAGRTWTFDEWSLYILRHPVLGRLACGLVWGVFEADTETPSKIFRPLEDGSLTDVDDNSVELAETDQIRIIHSLNLTPEQIAAWNEHLNDYEVKPLFAQFRQTPYRLQDEKKRETKIADFYGTKVMVYNLRSVATKQGFTRGETGDGGWFYEYVKSMPGLELDVVISFSGNALPEENNEVELYDLLFRTKTGREMSLEKVPPVLLSEMVRTLETLAGKAK